MRWRKKDCVMDDGTFYPYNMDIESIRTDEGQLYRLVFYDGDDDVLCAVLFTGDTLDALRDGITQVVGDRP